MTLLERPLLHVAGHDVSFLGLIAFAALFSAGLFVARALQSDAVRRFFSRFKIDNNFIAIVTTILSLAALVFFLVSAINAAGVPLAWNAPLPGVTLSLFQIFLLEFERLFLDGKLRDFPGEVLGDAFLYFEAMQVRADVVLVQVHRLTEAASGYVGTNQIGRAHV